MVSRSNLLRAVAPAVVALIDAAGFDRAREPGRLHAPPRPTPPRLPPSRRAADAAPIPRRPRHTTTTTTTTVAPPSGTTTTTVPTTDDDQHHDRRTDDDDGRHDPAGSGTTTTTTTHGAADGPTESSCGRSDIEYILLTIRWMESRETYDIPPNKGGASGAYQYIKKTWANYAGYPEAYLAPPWVQDERAAADVTSDPAPLRQRRLGGTDHLVLPGGAHQPGADGRRAQAGSRQRAHDPRLPVAVARHAGVLHGRTTPSHASTRSHPASSCCRGSRRSSPPPSPRVRPPLAFPLLGPAAVAPPPPCDGDACDDPNPAIVYGRKLQPVLAAADGVVTSVVFEDASTGRVEMTITDTAGTSYHYAGFNDDNPGTDDGDAPPALRLTALARVGTAVRAGQVIGFLGDSDREPINTTVAPASDVTADGTPAATDADPRPIRRPIRRQRRWSTSRSGRICDSRSRPSTAHRSTPTDPSSRRSSARRARSGSGRGRCPPNPAVFDGPIGDHRGPSRRPLRTLDDHRLRDRCRPPDSPR